MDFREVIETTGTCRFYRPDPVPDDVLRRVLDGTRYAPTGGNRQGVRFVAVRDPAKRRHLKELYLPLWEQYASRATARPGAPVPRLLANADHFARHLDEIPVLVVVCALFGPAAASDPRRSGQVSRLVKRLHLRGLVAKVPRARRVTHLGHAAMSAALQLREDRFPVAFLKEGSLLTHGDLRSLQRSLTGRLYLPKPLSATVDAGPLARRHDGGNGGARSGHPRTRTRSRAPRPAWWAVRVVGAQARRSWKQGFESARLHLRPSHSHPTGRPIIRGGVWR